MRVNLLIWCECICLFVISMVSIPRKPDRLGQSMSSRYSVKAVKFLVTGVRLRAQEVFLPETPLPWHATI